MAKRIAASELTRDNWEEEDEPEEKGVFQEASKEKLEGRILKKGKRRVLESGEKSGNSPFMAFSGFSKTTSIPTFSFTSNTTPTVTNGNSGTTEDVAEKSKKMAETTPTNNSSEYYRKLKCLNECFQQWIQKHLSKSPYCDFTPVCKDYERHLKQINSQYPIDDRKPKSELPSSTFKSSAQSSSNETPSFTFGLQPGGTATDSCAPATYIPVESKPFSFSAKALGVNVKPEQEETEEEGPPKNEFTPVEEPDSVYNKRCKLFYKKDDNFVDKGIGVLYLKKIDNKTQLLIRADTNLGHILLNIDLKKTLPMQRTGKNNVMIVCVPNPTIDTNSDPGPIPMLIRVKSSEDADELLSTLIDHAT